MNTHTLLSILALTAFVIHSEYVSAGTPVEEQFLCTGQTPDAERYCAQGMCAGLADATPEWGICAHRTRDCDSSPNWRPGGGLCPSPPEPIPSFEVGLCGRRNMSDSVGIDVSGANMCWVCSHPEVQFATDGPCQGWAMAPRCRNDSDCAILGIPCQFNSLGAGFCGRQLPPPPPPNLTMCRTNEDCSVDKSTPTPQCLPRNSSTEARAYAVRRASEQLTDDEDEESGGGDGDDDVICGCSHGSCVWLPKPIRQLPPNLTNSCGGSDGYCITDCSRSTCALVGDPRVSGPSACFYNPAHQGQVCGCRENQCNWIWMGPKARDSIRRYPAEIIKGPEFGLMNAIIHAPNEKVRARLIKNLERFQVRYNSKFDTLESVEMPENTMYINATKKVRILIWYVPINNEYHTNADGIVVAVIKNLWGRLLPYEVASTPIQPQPPILAAE